MFPNVLLAYPTVLVSIMELQPIAKAFICKFTSPLVVKNHVSIQRNGE